MSTQEPRNFFVRLRPSPEEPQMDQPRLNLPFVGVPTFLRAPQTTDLETIDADIAILGVPSDEGSPWYPGARMAPRRIREMSLRYAEYGGTHRRRRFLRPQ